MTKIITLRLTENDERMIKEIQTWYETNQEIYNITLNRTDIIRTAIHNLHYETVIKSNIMDK